MIIAASIILGILPGFAWLFFYLQEDPHPEPKSLLSITFFLGCAFAFFALIGQVFAKTSLQEIGVAWRDIFSITVFALIEEIFKFAAAYVAVSRSRDFDEPIDAMIYMIVAAMGFATIENLGAITAPASAAGLAGINSAFETASLRFVGATLLHSLSSGIIGYHWGYHMRSFLFSLPFFYSLAMATAVHTLFNYLILTYGDPFYSVLFVIVAGFFILHDFENLKKRPVAM